MRWANYLRPDLKHGQFSDVEEQTIVKIHSIVGNRYTTSIPLNVEKILQFLFFEKFNSYLERDRWSIIAAQLPGRTDTDVKNHWNTKLKKKLSGMGIDPVTHKPFSHLMAEIATTLERPQVAHLAEAAVGSFKDEILHLLTKRHMDFQLQRSNTAIGNAPATYVNSKHEEQDNDAIEKIKVGLSRAIQEPDVLWDSAGPTFANVTGNCSAFPFSVSGFPDEPSTFSNEQDGSLWNQSVCSGRTCTADDRQANLPEKLEENTEES